MRTIKSRGGLTSAFSIQKKLDGFNYADVSIKRSDRVKTLIKLNKPVILGNEKVHIDPTSLFSRLILIVERSSNIEPYFQYELAQMPTALFTDYNMRKSNKSDSSAFLIKDISSELPSTNSVYIDGGMLLHLMKWKKGDTFFEIVEEYRKIIAERYACCTVLFDSYGKGPSIKDHEHTGRRTKFIAEIDVNSSIIFQLNQQEFLANELNKSKFIRFLMGHLSDHGYTVDQSSNDADTLIVKQAL